MCYTIITPVTSDLTQNLPDLLRYLIINWLLLFGRSQWPLACKDCEYESRRRHGYLSLVRVVCCQVEVSESGRSIVQRSLTEYGVSVISKPQRPGRLDPQELLNYANKCLYELIANSLLYHWTGVCRTESSGRERIMKDS